MKRVMLAAAVGLAALSAPAEDVGVVTAQEHMKFVRQGGQWVAQPRATADRFGPAIAWDRTVFGPGSYRNTLAGDLVADWGDIATGTVVNGFDFSIVMAAGEQVQWTIFFTQDDNGGAIGGADPNDPNTDANSPGTRDFVAGWNFQYTRGGTGLAHVQFNFDAEIDPNDMFTLNGPDLDADGLTDFGYAYGIIARGASNCGPSIFGAGPDPIGSPGAENVFTRFSRTAAGNDPAVGTYFGWPDPNAPAGFFGNFVFGGANPPFAQFALRIYTDGDCIDPDGDGVCSSADDCPDVADPNQTDTDGDGIGDACDLCPGQALGDNGDRDGDGIGNPCDNCPDNANAAQEDCDADGIGDVCDPDGPCVTTCPNPGCDNGGVDADFNEDCIVNLTDLATLLINFGTDNGPGGAVVPNSSGNTDGDADVVLDDLANLLIRFGTDCN